MSAFDVAKKYLESMKSESEAIKRPEPARIEDGEIIAVEICSTALEAHIWLAFDDSFDPQDGQAVFYVDELEFLKTKTPEQLKEIHKVKLAFGPGSMVRQ
jgi:hypothetical protein